MDVHFHEQRSGAPEGDRFPFALWGEPLDHLWRTRQTQRKRFVCVVGEASYGQKFVSVRQKAVADEFLFAGLYNHLEGCAAQPV